MAKKLQFIVIFRIGDRMSEEDIIFQNHFYLSDEEEFEEWFYHEE